MRDAIVTYDNGNRRTISASAGIGMHEVVEVCAKRAPEGAKMFCLSICGATSAWQHLSKFNK